MINDKLSTMYSSGSPEGQPDTSEFMYKFFWYIIRKIIKIKLN